jgi:hypothetical protein
MLFSEMIETEKNGEPNAWENLFRDTPKNVIEDLDDRFIEISLAEAITLFLNNEKVFMVFVDGEFSILQEEQELMRSSKENAKIIITSLWETGVMFAFEK